LGAASFLGQRTYLPLDIWTDIRKAGHIGCRVGTSGTREDDPLPLSDPSRLHDRGVLRREGRWSHSLARSDLKPDAERDFPGLVPIQLKHLLKDPNANARETISALTAEVAELREEKEKLLEQLVAAGFRSDELAQVLQAMTEV
jgi:hypothetical protein